MVFKKIEKVDRQAALFFTESLNLSYKEDSKMQKIITSHRRRVIQAKRWAAEYPEKISLFDLEAVVEFYLLEDVFRLYDFRLKREQSRTPETDFGIIAHKSNLAKFSAIKTLFERAIDVARAMIESGNFKEVRTAIPEGKLARAARNVKNLEKLRDIAVALLRKLLDDATDVGVIGQSATEALEDLVSHDENVRRMQDLPSLDEIEATIAAAEEAIPSVGSKKNKPILN